MENHSSKKCNQCNEIVTIEHHLVHCTNTYKFWQMVFNWWAQNVRVWFQVDTYEIIFGIPNERNEAIVNQLNFIILIAKYYIYRCKKADKTTEVYEFLLECRNQMMIKYEISNATGNNDTFHKRWGELYECLVE